MLNSYVLNSILTKFMKLKLTELKEKIDKCTITVQDFSIFFSVTYKTSKEKITKDIEGNNMIN